MDELDSIISSIDSANRVETTNTAETNSDVPNVEEVETTSAETSKTDENKDGEETQISGESNDVSGYEKPEVTETEAVKETEAKSRKRKSYHRNGSSELERAKYSASKWQRKYKQLRADFDSKLADFEKYRDLDISKFDNEEDKHQYLAWKADIQQKLQNADDAMQECVRGYNSELDNYEYEIARQDNAIYQEKVDDIYGNNADKFRELDNHWSETFDTACQLYDKDGVVADFIRNSDFGPAIKNVIYENDAIQSDLFEKSSGNAMIDASERLRILKGIEASIIKFLNTPKTAQTNVAPMKPNKRVLPHLPARNNVTTPNPPAKKMQVTGSLTKGNSPSGERDPHSEVGDLYHSIFG